MLKRFLVVILACLIVGSNAHAANVNITDGASNSKYLKSTGAGSDADPYIPQHLETNSASITTSVQLIDDGVATTGSAITTKGMAAVGTDGTNARIVKTNTGGELIMSNNITVITATLTRPGDTTAYAVGDAITDSTSSPTVITFDGVCRANAGSGFIVSAMLLTSTAAATALEADLRILNTTFTATNDNSAFALTDGEAATIVPDGVIVFSSANAVSNTNNRVYRATIARPIPFTCGASSDDVFGGLVAQNAYTPANAEVFTIRLGIIRAN